MRSSGSSSAGPSPGSTSSRRPAVVAVRAPASPPGSGALSCAESQSLESTDRTAVARGRPSLLGSPVRQGNQPPCTRAPCRGRRFPTRGSMGRSASTSPGSWSIGPSFLCWKWCAAMAASRCQRPDSDAGATGEKERTASASRWPARWSNSGSSTGWARPSPEHWASGAGPFPPLPMWPPGLLPGPDRCGRRPTPPVGADSGTMYR